jgi:hypothetical protein
MSGVLSSLPHMPSWRVQEKPNRYAVRIKLRAVSDAPHKLLHTVCTCKSNPPPYCNNNNNNYYYYYYYYSRSVNDIPMWSVAVHNFEIA